MAITASIIGSNFITAMINGTTHTIDGTHPNYSAIRDALRRKDHVVAEQLINVAKAITNYVSGRVRIDGDQVFYGDREVKGSVVTRILGMIKEGFDPKPMINFLDNLMANPSRRAVNELYDFLEATNLPITEDGYFLAYKKVNDNYKDLYTGTMDNSVGSTPSMPRNAVNEDKDQTCSEGLHFCSFSYLPHYHGGRGKVMIVKVNPRDVVSIPSDYNNAKGRACEYKVIGEHKGHEKTEAFTSSVYNNMTPVKPTPIAAPSYAAVKPVATKVTPAPKAKSPSLTGYNNGRSDASRGKHYDDTSSMFSGSDADAYANAYRKGFDSLKGSSTATAKPAATSTTIISKNDYDDGYDAGADKANIDSEDCVAPNHTPPTGVSAEYSRGFMDGYDDNYYAEWYDIGYNHATAAVDAKRPYDDTIPYNCTDSEDQASYIEGYATGWRDRKIDLL